MTAYAYGPANPLPISTAAEKPALSLLSWDSLTLAAGGTISATGWDADGIYSSGASVSMSLGGLVSSADGAAIRTSIGTQQITITPTGKLQGAWYGLLINDYDSYPLRSNSIYNQGEIVGDKGIQVVGGVTTLVNDGTIRGTTAIRAEGSEWYEEDVYYDDEGNEIYEYSDPAEAMIITNNGTIQTLGAYAIYGYGAKVTITNNGSILGAIETDFGCDKYDGRFGSVTGAVSLLSGNDTAYGGAGVEYLNGGRGNDRLNGYGGDDWLYGGHDEDVILGGVGNDKLYGGTGKDRLTGGAGNDTFVFNTKPNKNTNLDWITDFSVKYDSVWLENKIMTKVGSGSATKPGKLLAGKFYAGTQAHDGDDRLIYNKTTGALYYDKDGTGSSVKVQIATLDKNLKLTHKDFFII